MSETMTEQDTAAPAAWTVDEQLVASLVERARGEGLSLTGPDGLLGQLPGGCWSPRWTVS